MRTQADVLLVLLSLIAPDELRDELKAWNAEEQHLRLVVAN